MHLVNKKLGLFTVALALAATNIMSAEEKKAVKPQAGINETKEQRDARMAWWREARFGMFIHWGIYSVPAGVYEGKRARFGEWIMNQCKIPVAAYSEYAKQFNPVKFNAEEWVRIAKNAGMKYIVITSKHHDGFAMFKSEACKFNIVDATPFKRDPLKDLAEACRKEGIKLGFYYSQDQDWNNGGSCARGGPWDPAQPTDMDAYIDNIAVPQLKEICSNYGKDTPVMLWWDSPHNMNGKRGQKLYEAVKSLKPDVIFNNRLGGYHAGDYITPENFVPAGASEQDWETCMTMNDTWGFESFDKNWKSAETLIHHLVDVASKGGNLLLNVGPTSEGLIPGPSVERLAEVGAWMKVNSEAIYGAKKTPFGYEFGKRSPTKKRAEYIDKLDWRCTTKPGKLYFHLFKWPDGKLEVKDMKDKAVKAYLIADPDRKPLTVAQDGDKLTVTLPSTAPDKYASVICVETR